MNTTGIGAKSFAYDADNRMVSASGGGLVSPSLAYDVQGRLYSLVTASTTTRFLYDGVEAIAEYDGAGVAPKNLTNNPGGAATAEGVMRTRN